jgi:hypothetical protein
MKPVSSRTSVGSSRRSNAAMERLPEGAIENCAGTDRTSRISASESEELHVSGMVQKLNLEEKCFRRVS